MTEDTTLPEVEFNPDFIFNLPDLPTHHWGGAELRMRLAEGTINRITFAKLLTLPAPGWGYDDDGVLEIPLFMQWDDVHIRTLVISPRREIDGGDGENALGSQICCSAQRRPEMYKILANMNARAAGARGHLAEDRKYNFHVVVGTLITNKMINQYPPLPDEVDGAPCMLQGLLQDMKFAVPLEQLPVHLQCKGANLLSEVQASDERDTRSAENEADAYSALGRDELSFDSLPIEVYGRNCALGQDTLAVTMPTIVWRKLSYPTPGGNRRLLRRVAVPAIGYDWKTEIESSKWTRPRMQYKEGGALYHKEQIFLARAPTADDGPTMASRSSAGHSFAMVWFCDSVELGGYGGIWLPHSTIHSNIPWMSIDVRNCMRKFMDRSNRVGVADFSLTGRGRVSRKEAVLQLLRSEQAFFRRMVLATIQDIDPENIVLKGSAAIIRDRAYGLITEGSSVTASTEEIDRLFEDELNKEGDKTNDDDEGVFTLLGQ
jgi:hypothetical protein